MRASPAVTRVLCALLAGAVLVPPGALRAQDPPQQAPGGPDQAEEGEPVQDLTPLERLDVDPTTGDLVFASCDLTLGEGEQAFRLTRTWRPFAGDALDFGTHWASPLDVHLDVDRDGARAGLVDAAGGRTFFRKDAQGVLRAVTGRSSAEITVMADGYLVAGLGDERTWRFDREGWPVAIQAPGATWSYVYDAQQRLLRLEGPAGAIALERDAAGALVAARAPGGVEVRWLRDQAGNLTRVTRAGTYEDLGYDALGRLRTLAGGQAQISWDAASRVTAIKGPGVRPVELSYAQSSEPEQALLTTVRREGTTTTLTVSQDRRRLAWSSPTDPAALTVLLRDERERPVELRSPAGTTWSWRYDERGRLAQEKGPAGQTRYEYGSRVTDRPTRVELPDGRALEFAYDLKGLLTRAASTGQGETRFVYDAQGRLVERTDARGAVTRWQWDERSLLLAQEEVGLGTTRFGRDEQGRVRAVKADTGQVIKVDYDPQGRVRLVSDARGALMAADFDARGNLVRYLDELGQETRWSYGPRGELLEARDALGALGKWSYGPDGRLASFSDGAGNETRWERPDAHTLVVKDPTTGTRQLSFDAEGRLSREVRAGVELGYTWDPLGNLVARSTPAGQETFARDPLGRLTGLAGPAGGLALRYDEAGRLAGLKETTFGREVSYGYTPAGDRSELRLPWGTVKYRLDQRGRVTGITLPSGEALEIALRPDGAREAIRYPNGVVTRFAYDRGRLVDVHTVKGEQTLDRRRYGWGPRGRLAWVEDASGRRTTYEHDARGRLVRAQGPQGDQRWSWDGAGNRTGETRDGQTIASTVAAGNRLASHGATKLGYGPTGALTTLEDARGTTRLEYDHDDHLVQVTGPDGAVVRYGYAPNGTRLWREDARGRTWFLSDLSDVVAELDAQGNVVAGYVHGEGTDDLLAAVKDGESLFYHHDLVQSVTAITGKDGRLAARYAYDAFGRELTAEGELAGWNRFRYTSREQDAQTGLYHYRARTYAPELGRFTSADPAGRMGGFNLYAYVENDPTAWNDPFGLDPTRPWWKRAWDKVSDVASSVATHTVAFGKVLAEDFVSGDMGRRVIAFGRGFGKGLWAAGTGIVNMALHPIDTINGIAYALENWDETKAALLAKWEEYKDAAVNDPEKFAEMTGYLTAEIVASLTPAAVASVASKSATVARLANSARGLSTAARARVVASPAVRAVSSAGRSVSSGLANRFPATARVVREGTRLSRLRDAELARRAAAGGNIFSRAGRRVANVGRDLGAAGRLAVRAPGPFVVYSGHRMGRAAAALVASTGRGVWTLRKVAIPTVLVFNDQITDAINRTATREAAGREVAVLARRFLADAPHLPPDELARRLAEVGAAYDTYRNRLMAPLHEEDLRLDAKLKELEAAIARGEIPANTIDSRLNAMLLNDYAPRRRVILTDIYERNRDAHHDMFDPSPNRLLAYQDEVAFLDAALAKVTDPAGRRLLEARKADITDRAALEEERFRQGDYEALVSGVAGPPRDPGQPAAALPPEERAPEATALDDLIAPAAPLAEGEAEAPVAPSGSEGPDWPTEGDGQ